MKYIFIAVGLIICVFSYFVGKQKMREYNVEKNGVIVDMKIIDIPGFCSGTKVKHHIRLDYEGEIFMTPIGPNYCDEHHLGEIVKMKIIKGEHIVMFPYESVMIDFYLDLGIFLFGLYIIFHGFKYL